MVKSWHNKVNFEKQCLLLPIHVNFPVLQDIQVNSSLFKAQFKSRCGLGLVHTYPDLFENASFFIRIKKDPRPHEDRFQKYPCPHENAVTFEICYSKVKFDIR